MRSTTFHGLVRGGEDRAVLKTPLLFLLVLTLLTSLPARADEEIEQLAERMAMTKQKLLDEERNQRKILSGLYAINKKMKTMSERKSRLSDEVVAAELSAKKVAKSIALLEGKIDIERQGLSKRLRTLYLLNGHGAMRILFSAQNGQEFDRNLKYLKILSERDYRVIRDFESNLKLLVKQKEKLRVRVEKLVRSQRRLKEQREQLSAQQDSKSKLLEDLRTTRSRYEARLKGLRARADVAEIGDVSQEVEALLKPSFFEQRGQLPAPIEGLITEAFGVIENEEFGLQLAHKGLAYSAPEGTEIRSVFDGQILFQGRLPGYGNTTIVDHGDNYYTVFTHLKKFEKSQGQSIIAGETIGRSGYNTERRESGMYFEIRHFSEAIDPKVWLKHEDMKRSQI